MKSTVGAHSEHTHAHRSKAVQHFVVVGAVIAFVGYTPYAQAQTASCEYLSRYKTQDINNVYLVDKNLSSLPGWTEPEIIQAVNEALSVWNQDTEGPAFVYQGLGNSSDVPPEYSPCRGQCSAKNTIEFGACDQPTNRTILGFMDARCEINKGFCLHVVN